MLSTNKFPYEFYLEIKLHVTIMISPVIDMCRSYHIYQCSLFSNTYHVRVVIETCKIHKIKYCWQPGK